MHFLHILTFEAIFTPKLPIELIRSIFLVEMASPRSDISMTRVNHIENIKSLWHKPEITRQLFDKCFAMCLFQFY